MAPGHHRTRREGRRYAGGYGEDLRVTVSLSEAADSLDALSKTREDGCHSRGRCTITRSTDGVPGWPEAQDTIGPVRSRFWALEIPATDHGCR
jgi:hypothetical protein